MVSCSGEQHRVTWRRGKVVLEDHDLGAEEAMLAFGGRPCACLEVLHRWRDMRSWAMSVGLFQQMQARLGPANLPVPQELLPVQELTLLLTWERSWRRWGRSSDYERLVGEELRKRALGPLREHLAVWRQRAGARLVSPPQVRVLRPGQRPRLLGSIDRVRATATAVLGVPWVLRVWARGIAVVDDAFVLEVTEEPEETYGETSGARVLAARWQAQPSGVWAPVAGPARVRGQGEGRRLDWEGETSPPERHRAPAS